MVFYYNSNTLYSRFIELTFHFYDKSGKLKKEYTLNNNIPVSIKISQGVLNSLDSFVPTGFKMSIELFTTPYTLNTLYPNSNIIKDIAEYSAKGTETGFDGGVFASVKFGYRSLNSLPIFRKVKIFKTSTIKDNTNIKFILESVSAEAYNNTAKITHKELNKVFDVKNEKITYKDVLLYIYSAPFSTSFKIDSWEKLESVYKIYYSPNLKEKLETQITNVKGKYNVFFADNTGENIAIKEAIIDTWKDFKKKVLKNQGFILKNILNNSKVSEKSLPEKFLSIGLVGEEDVFENQNEIYIFDDSVITGVVERTTLDNASIVKLNTIFDPNMLNSNFFIIKSKFISSLALSISDNKITDNSYLNSYQLEGENITGKIKFNKGDVVDSSLLKDFEKNKFVPISYDFSFTTLAGGSVPTISWVLNGNQSIPLNGGVSKI